MSSDGSAPGSVEERRSSLDRMLDILTLFDEGQPVWTVEAMLKQLGYSRATAYRYVRSLCRIGLLDPVSGGGYVLGPAVLEWEHLVRSADPLLAASIPLMERIRAQTGETTILARPYRDRILCIQVTPGLTGLPAQLDRGRPLPRFQGAASKVILAHLGGRRLRSLWDAESTAMREAGLGDDLDGVRSAASAIRYQGHAETVGELGAHVADCAAPILNGDGAVLGSLGLVAVNPDGHGLPDEQVVAVVEAAAEVTRALQGPESPLGAPSRIGTGPPAARSAHDSAATPS